MNPPEKLVSHEFEQRVLGAALRGPGYHYLTDNGITRDMFTSAPHRVIFDAIKGMADARRDVDPSTVAEWLVFRDLNDDAVNAAYLWELVSMRNSGTDAEIVRAKAQMRKAWGVMASAQAAAADGNLDVSALIASLVKLDQPASSHEHNANAIIQAAIDEIERQVAGITAGVKYGVESLDAATGGAHDGDLVVIAARAAMGKTAFLVNVMTNAILAGQSTGFISAEMPAAQIGIRIGSLVGRVSASGARQGKWGHTEFAQFSNGLGRTLGAGDLLVVNDAPHIGIGEVEACARRWVRQRGIKALYLDYIQRIQGSDPSKPRHEQVTEVVQRLKTLARDLNIPVIALAQMNRDNDKNADKRPQLGGIANSSEIEKEADQIMTLYRDEVYHPDTNDRGVCEVDFKKNRHGPTGCVPLAWTGNLMLFADLDKNKRDYDE